ncbi:uncharacterized protein LOC117651752 [Thrips palmi]|uniref:Uncharacterized protein LOC117651752 n=1 Tax=Thrips palmi TaxID=161013 RepID=A0A6P9A616_THRPL|nr:uncharacterized protein LOC117651752 [Thrips palmi]
MNTVIAVLVLVAAAAAAPPFLDFAKEADDGGPFGVAAGPRLPQQDSDADILDRIFQALKEEGVGQVGQVGQDAVNQDSSQDDDDDENDSFESPPPKGVSCDDHACNKACEVMLGFSGGFCNHYKLCTCVRIPSPRHPAPWAANHGPRL